MKMKLRLPSVPEQFLRLFMKITRRIHAIRSCTVLLQRFRQPTELAGIISRLFVEDTRCFDVRFTSDGTKNARHNCYETDTSRTIDTGGNSPDSNQGGVAVVAVQGSNDRQSR